MGHHWGNQNRSKVNREKPGKNAPRREKKGHNNCFDTGGKGRYLISGVKKKKNLGGGGLELEFFRTIEMRTLEQRGPDLQIWEKGNNKNGGGCSWANFTGLVKTGGCGRPNWIGGQKVNP